MCETVVGVDYGTVEIKRYDETGLGLALKATKPYFLLTKNNKNILRLPGYDTHLS